MAWFSPSDFRLQLHLHDDVTCSRNNEEMAPTVRGWTRRQLGALAFSPLLSAAEDSHRFRFGVIADTHIIDSFYQVPKDDDSLQKTSARLEEVGKHLSSLKPKLDMVFLVGDLFHTYPSTDIDFFFQNKTSIDFAKEITDGFAMPVHIGFGNHDYFVPRVSQEASHELFRRKLGVKPYYSIDHKGFKFVHLSNFLGNTWRQEHAEYNRALGSLGEEQLNWFEAELEQGRPTFVFIHFPLTMITRAERKDYGLLQLLKKHKDTVQRVVSGHWHRWFEFGRSFGPQHLVMAATRFDTDAYLIVEVDRRKSTHELLNIDGVDWNTRFSEPYPSRKG